MKMYEIALFWAVDLPVTKDGRGSIFKRVIKWIVIISVLVTPLVCSGVTVGVSVGVPLIRDTIFKTESGTLQFIAYLGTFTYVAIIGVLGLYVIILPTCMEDIRIFPQHDGNN